MTSGFNRYGLIGLLGLVLATLGLRPTRAFALDCNGNGVDDTCDEWHCRPEVLFCAAVMFFRFFVEAVVGSLASVGSGAGVV